MMNTMKKNEPEVNLVKWNDTVSYFLKPRSTFPFFFSTNICVKKVHQN